MTAIDAPAPAAGALPKTPAGADLLRLEGVSKSFGGVEALKGVDFSLRAGEVHALVGENGAGKSTLMKVLAGVHTADAGTLTLDGRQVRFRSARDAHEYGVGMVHQELSIAPDLTVAENVYLGVQPVTRWGVVDWKAMFASASTLLDRLGLAIDPRQRAGDLPIGLQQLIELARVLFSGARVVILDEPTSALSPPEIKRLFEVLHRLKTEEGRAFVFISHFIEDVLQVADRVTVLRNGERVATARADEIDKSWVIREMLGIGHDELAGSYTGAVTMGGTASGAPVLSVSNLTFRPHFTDVSFDVRPGEVLGIYGFMGCGQLELARALFGKLKPDRGAITLAGDTKRYANTSAAKRAGTAFVPESRAAMLFSEQPIYTNMSIAVLEHIHRLFLKPEREKGLARGHVASLGVRPADETMRLGALSGGNQQKVALGRWMTELPRVLVMCEPTRGMDVGAKEDVVRIVKDLARQGVAVIVMSTEPETVLSLATRVLVLRKGELVASFEDGPVAKDDLLAAA